MILPGGVEQKPQNTGDGSGGSMLNMKNAIVLQEYQ